MSVDLKEFLAAYLAEVDENVTAANARLLAIDASLQAGQKNPRAVRDLFRALHTIKGLSAMVEVDSVVAIAHDMEAAVRAADRAGGDLAASSIEPLLEGLRAIEARLLAVGAGNEAPPAPKELLERLEELALGEPERSPAPPAEALALDPAIASKLAPFEIAQLRDAASVGARAVRLDFVPSPERSAAGFTIGTVRDRVGAVAEIVKVVPLSSPVSPERPGGLSFAMILVTRADDATLAAAGGVDLDALALLDAPTALARDADEAPSSTLVPAPLPDDAAPAPRRSVLRVEVARVDDAMEKVAALIVTRSRLARIVAALTERGVDTRELAAALADNARQLRDLRGSMLRVRMVAVSEAFERLPLLVRGLCRATGKSARLEVDAGNAEIDKAVAERLLPALVHLLRNAVDHGIESPEERVRRGKPPAGAVRIACVSRSNRQLTITISDDGRGIDPAAVARKCGRELAPSSSALLDALCEPGLSTRDRVTETSGRGMGMDIVKRVTVDQLGGELALDTTYGAGTVFTLRVPLTIAIVDAFTVQCAAHRFVVPVSHVDEIVDVASSNMHPAPGGGRRGGVVAGLLERRGEAIPFVSLAAALSFDAASSRSVHALVVRRGADAVAFGLDRVLGQQEAVVRPLVDPLVQVPGVAGSTDLGDGRATLVLDLASLCATLARERAA